MSKALVLLSGGMDSATTAALASERHDEVHALNMFYGQKHDVEVECAKALADELNLDSYNELDLSPVFENMNSSLLQHNSKTVKDTNHNKSDVGSTYVPARNAIFLSVAAGYADSIGAEYVYYGAHAEDGDSYPDTTIEFFNKISLALTAGTSTNVQIEAPFIYHSKTDVVYVGDSLKVPFNFTHTCYYGSRPACGECSSCKLRLASFREAGMEDPLEYITRGDE